MVDARFGARAIGRSLLGLAFALGCAQIFGIDEACLAGESGCTPVNLTCEAEDSAPVTSDADAACPEYCRVITANCAERPQYADESDCLSLCPHFPRAPDANPKAANTLECRLSVAQNIVETNDCDVAGRLGDGGCGSNCDSYCSLMKALCPENYCEFARSNALADDEAACQAHCATLLDREAYDPRAEGSVDQFETDDNGPMVPTVQCRLWHLGSAAEVFARSGQKNNAHCEHAVARGDCIGPPTPL